MMRSRHASTGSRPEPADRKAHRLGVVHRLPSCRMTVQCQKAPGIRRHLILRWRISRAPGTTP